MMQDQKQNVWQFCWSNSNSNHHLDCPKIFMLCHNSVSQKVYSKFKTKEIEMIHRLFVVIAMYCQASSPAVQWITKPPTLQKVR